MLELPDVMVCAVSSVAIEQTVAALEHSCRGIRFGDAVLLSDQRPDLSPDSPIRWQPIDPLRSREAYSRFMIKDLARYSTRPFVLVVQWDGFVIHPGLWQHRFLDYDYVGAPWPQFDDGMSVGNGGFSLRSHRLLEVLRGDAFPALHPEDTAICRDFRPMLEDRHGIRFAPPAVASAFSSERDGDISAAFGFHGLYNFPDALSPRELLAALALLPDSALKGVDGRDLVARLVLRGYRGLAWQALIRRVRQLGAPWKGWSWKDWQLIAGLVRDTCRPARHRSAPPVPRDPAGVAPDGIGRA